MTSERKQVTGDWKRGTDTGRARTQDALAEDAASRTLARACDLMGYGYGNTCTGNTLRSRASVREARTRVRDDLYGPAIARDVDVAVDHNARLRGKTWRDLGIPKATFHFRLKKVEKFFTRMNIE